MNVAAWADENLELYGEYEAVVHGSRSWTSVEVHARSSALAAAMVAQGLRPGDRVALALPNGIELVVAFTAVLRAGGVAVVLSDHAPAADLGRLLADCAPVGLITGRAVGLTPHTDLRFVVDASGPDWAAWLGSSARAKPVDRGPDDPAQLVYTSGTTGEPKGVIYTHGNVASRYPAPRERVPAGGAPRPVVRLMVLPASHALGGSFLYLRLISKTKLVCLDGFEPQEVLRAIEEHGVTSTVLVPAICEALVATPDAERFDLSTLRSVSVGAAAVTPSLIERFERRFKVRLSISYGLTEAPAVTIGLSSGDRGAVGRLAPGVEARVVDARGAPLAPGEVGELQLKSASLSRPLRAPGAGAVAENDGWLSTGDLGRVGPNRELFVVGRTSELINQGGVKIHPGEITERVAQLGVEACAVVGVPNPLLGEEAVLCVVLREGSSLGEDDLLAHCLAGLERGKVPASVHFFAQLPQTELGKVKLAALREAVLARRAAVTETANLTTLRATPEPQRRALLEGEVQIALARVLGPAMPARLQPTATFGELGLDSLGAVRLANALSVALGTAVSPVVLFDHPTLRALGDHLLAVLFPPARREPEAAPLTRTRTAEPIAIVGAGCRLPGGAAGDVVSPEQFFARLREGLDAVRAAPRARFDLDALYDPRRGTPGRSYVREGGFLDAPDLFDAGFFGLGQREAADIDPQQRLLLEASWRAIEDAGHAPTELARGKTGVFFGVTGSSYSSGSLLGLLPCMAAGRVSHFLNLHGPSMAIDTACSSSLVAVHGAVESLRQGACDAALAGGVHVMGSPRAFVMLSAMQALAADGRSKAFDARADGYGRGEGCAVLMFKRLSDAVADRDRVLAVILGGAVNHDGRSTTLTAPNGAAQQAVIREALAAAGVAAADVDYLEAHGTGTQLGDPIEVNAALAALGRRERPLFIGSVKTNVGHLEAAAGATGLLKLALSLHYGELPPHLHLSELNPQLLSLADRFAVPTRAQPWPGRAGGPRLGGISSFGLSGTNVHLVLAEAPPRPPRAPPGGLELMCISARSEGSVAEQAERLAPALSALPVEALGDACFTVNAGRARFPVRRFAVGGSTLALAQGLARPASAAAGRAVEQPGRLAFVFTGQGSQYAGMGRRLYESQPVFRRELQRCAEVLAPLLPRPLLEVLHAETSATAGAGIDDAAIAQPALFAVEWALAQQWLHWGVRPSLVLGHSLGEYVAACVAGLFSVEDGLRLVAERGRLTQSLPATGGMLAMFCGEAQALEAIAPFPDQLALASLNGATATVVSGARAALDRVAGWAAERGVRTRRLDVAYAYHSPLMDPILEPWERAASQVRYQPLRTGLVSTLTGARVDDDAVSRPAYWRRHLREPVRFAAGIDALVCDGVDAFLEIGPDPVLTAMGRQHLSPRLDAAAWFPSLRRERPDDLQMLESLGGLWLRGLEPDWKALHVERGRLPLPGYAFEPVSCWSTRLGATPAAPRPPRPSSSAAPPATQAERVEQLRVCLAEVLDRPPDSFASDANLLEQGLDSLKVMELLQRVHRNLGVACAAADFIQRPTLDAFAVFLGAAQPVAAVRAPLVTLHGSGARTPLFCFHPAGGQVTAYLRLRGALGDEQPLYALQSRAGRGAEHEHPDLASLAIDYATVVQNARPEAPCRLFGWSMGGFIAHAVAHELERRGHPVAGVDLIDARPAGRRGLSDLSLALQGIRGELQLDDGSRGAAAALASLDERVGGPAEVLAWCEERGLLPGGAVPPDAFAAALALYRRHLEMVREHRPKAVKAPLRLWWAGSHADPFWVPFAAGPLSERIIGGTHFTVIRPPHVDEVLVALRAGRAQ